MHQIVRRTLCIDFQIFSVTYYFSFDKEEFTTKVNDDFGVEFYHFNMESIREIENKIEEWKNYYKENKIRFTIKHLDLISDNYNYSENSPKYLQPKDYNSIDIKSHFKTYANEKYFDDIETAIKELIDFFNDTPELQELFLQKRKDLNKIKMKFTNAIRKLI